VRANAQVILRNEVVEKAKPGDKCIFTGVLIVIPDISQFSSQGAAAAAILAALEAPADKRGWGLQVPSKCAAPRTAARSTRASAASRRSVCETSHTR
jgi:hypothetical protein